MSLPTRSFRLVAVTATLLGTLFAGCGDEGSTTAAGPTSGEDATGAGDAEVSTETCELLQSLFEPVDGSRESVPLEEEADSLATFAESAPDEVADQAQSLSDSAAGLLTEGTPEEVADLDAVAEAFTTAADALIAWAGPTCAGDQLIWACASPTGFLEVMLMPSDDLPEIDAEELLGPDAADRVEVDHPDFGVLYAATDDAGLVTDAIQIIPTPDGWERGNPQECE